MNEQVLSYGGGVQSVAMCVLVARGILPRPDYIVMADTGREARNTWEYLDNELGPYLAAAELTVHIAGHDLATVDLYGKNGDLLMPVFTERGKLATFCSNEWKARVIDRWLRDRGVGKHTAWIGFSLDEKHRVKGQEGRAYPLLDLMLTRGDCAALITHAGLPIPQKSACFMCPHRTNAEWRIIRDRYPDQWQEALTIDQDLREADTQGGVFLHSDRVPLGSADLTRDNRRELGDQCGLGFCFV